MARIQEHHITRDNKGRLRGKNHPNYKGDEAGLKAIHNYVSARKPKPALCECCNKEQQRDLSSNGHTYTRNPVDYEWLCRKCHIIKDGTKYWLGKNRSEDTKRKISETKTGANMGVTHHLAKAIILVTPDGFEERFGCMRDACRKYDLVPTNLTAIAKGRGKTYKGFVCKYA